MDRWIGMAQGLRPFMPWRKCGTKKEKRSDDGARIFNFVRTSGFWIFSRSWVFCMWKPWISSLKWGMVDCVPPRIDWVPSQNAEVTWLRPAHSRKQQNNTKFDVVWNVLNQVYFWKMYVSSKIQTIWRQQNQISRKLVDLGQRNLSWKKGGLVVSKTTLHWEMARKIGLLNLFDCHFAISCSWVGYHTSSERGISGRSAD